MANRELDTVTVGMLIKMLQRYPDELPIVFAHPSHDYWRTELAGEISEIAEGVIAYTGYHERFKTVDSEREEDDDTISVLVLR